MIGSRPAADTARPQIASLAFAAHTFSNSSQSDILDDFRRLRTEQVIRLGWRQPQHLSDGQDRDRYDLIDSDTLTVVVASSNHTALAGARLTRHHGDPRSSLSFEMWPELPRILPREFVSLYEDGLLFDMTRLISGEGLGSRYSLLTIGVGVAATQATMGAFFTAHTKFERLLDISGIETHIVHRGALGGVPSALLYVRPEAWAKVKTRRARTQLDKGAWLLEKSQTGALHVLDPERPETDGLFPELEDLGAVSLPDEFQPS